MNKKGAEKIRDHALVSIDYLAKALRIAKDECNEDEYKVLMRAVGSCIGHIEMELLSKLYAEHPDIDDLK